MSRVAGFRRGEPERFVARFERFVCDADVTFAVSNDW